jgi:hypothetical protein
MENMDCFVEMIHMVCRKLKYFHHYWVYMRGMGVKFYLAEIPHASWVPVGVTPMAKREKHDMIVGELQEVIRCPSIWLNILVFTIIR